MNEPLNGTNTIETKANFMKLNNNFHSLPQNFIFCCRIFFNSMKFWSINIPETQRAAEIKLKSYDIAILKFLLIELIFESFFCFGLEKTLNRTYIMETKQIL
jgi:hypothetical protein